MDPFLAQMSMGEVPEEELRALAAALRGQSSTGGRLAASSLKNLQDQGQTMQKAAMLGAENTGLQEYRKKQVEQSNLDRQQRELESRRRAASDAATSKAIEGRGMAKMSGSYMEKIRDEGEQFSKNKDIFERYRPEYSSKAGIAPLGEVGRFIASDYPTLGKVGEKLGIVPEGEVDRQQQSANWFADLDFYRNNPVRHALFGSALTEPERKLWRASTINENMDEETMNYRLSMMRLLDKKAQAYKIMQLRAEQVPEEMLRTNYGMDFSEEEMSNPRQVYDEVTELVQGLADQNTAAYSSARDLTDEELDAAIAAGGQ